MYQNPYSIKSGEFLNYQMLFDRFIDWNIFTQQFFSTTNLSCDKFLKEHLLCCPIHLQYKSESDTFFRYFDYLGMLSIGKLPSLALITQNLHASNTHLGPFTVVTFAAVISSFHLRVDREKYLKVWGTNGERALNYLG